MDYNLMKPPLAVDEMFPEGAGFMEVEESPGTSGTMVDLGNTEKQVHADFYNNFDDLFDDEELDEILFLKEKNDSNAVLN